MFSVKIISKASKRNSLVVRVTNKRRSAEVSLGLSATQDEVSMALTPNPPGHLRNLARALRSYVSKIEEVRADLIE